MAKSETPPISDESLAMLVGDVKKGKPRKFFFIYKGANIQTLIVFKKGAYNAKVMQAKKDGFKGEVCQGVVIGSGQSLTFQLAGNAEVATAMKIDSWAEESPITVAKAREFMKEAGYVCKPEFSLITAVADVVDPESDPESDPETPPPSSQSTQGDASNDSVPSSPTPDTTQDEESRFKARLTQVVQMLKAAAGTSAADEAKLKASEAGTFARKGEFTQGHKLLDEAERLLSAASVAPASPAVSDDSALVAKLSEALKKLKVMADQIIKSDPSKHSQLTATVVKIATEIKSRQLDQAQQSVSEFAKLLKSLATPQQGPSSGTPTDEMAQFNQRRTSLETQLGQAEQIDQARATKMRAVLNLAIEQANAANYANAFKALDRISQALNEILGSTGSVSNDGNAQSGQMDENAFRPKWQVAKAAWQDASDEVDSQIGRLQVALRERNDDDLKEIAEFGLNGVTGGYKVPMMAAIRDVDSASGDKLSAAVQKALGAATSFSSYLQSEEAVTVCDNNPFGVEVSILDTLGEALDSLIKTLQSAR